MVGSGVSLSNHLTPDYGDTRTSHTKHSKSDICDNFSTSVLLHLLHGNGPGVFPVLSFLVHKSTLEHRPNFVVRDTEHHADPLYGLYSGSTSDARNSKKKQ